MGSALLLMLSCPMVNHGKYSSNECFGCSTVVYNEFGSRSSELDMCTMAGRPSVPARAISVANIPLKSVSLAPSDLEAFEYERRV